MVMDHLPHPSPAATLLDNRRCWYSTAASGELRLLTISNTAYSAL